MVPGMSSSGVLEQRMSGMGQAAVMGCDGLAARTAATGCPAWTGRVAVARRDAAMGKAPGWPKRMAVLVLAALPFMAGCATMGGEAKRSGDESTLTKENALAEQAGRVRMPLSTIASGEDTTAPKRQQKSVLSSASHERHAMSRMSSTNARSASAAMSGRPMPLSVASLAPKTISDADNALVKSGPRTTAQSSAAARQLAAGHGGTVSTLAGATAGKVSVPVESLNHARAAGGHPGMIRPVQTDEITLSLGVGQAHLLNVGEVRRAAVGNGRILQVNALDNRQLLLLPESVGESSLHLWLKSGEIRKYRIQVTAQNQHRLVEEINALLGQDSGVIARVAGNKIVIEGEQPTEEGSYRVGEVLKRYPEVVSLVSRTGFERMVNLDVKMIEVSRNALKQLGVRWYSGAGAWSMAGPNFGVLGDFKRSAALLPGGSGEAAAQAAGIPVFPLVSPFATSVSIASSLRSMIDVMVQNGDAAVLAEPRLSTRSGGNARFVAGGELPLPVLGGNGSASVQFKEYGVRFDVSPTVNAQGIISASLHTEISSINEDVQVQGMPGLRKQSASTDVNLRPGQTLVIAGMVSQEMTGAVEKIPGLGDLPIIGHLFKSRRFRNRETEMIVLITPHLADEGAQTSEARLAPIESRFRQIKEAVGMLD